MQQHGYASLLGFLVKCDDLKSVVASDQKRGLSHPGYGSEQRWRYRDEPVCLNKLLWRRCNCFPVCPLISAVASLRGRCASISHNTRPPSSSSSLLALWTDLWPEGSPSKLQRRREGRKRKGEVKKREGGSEAMIGEGERERDIKNGGIEKGSP